MTVSFTDPFHIFAHDYQSLGLSLPSPAAPPRHLRPGEGVGSNRMRMREYQRHLSKKKKTTYIM